MALFSFSFETAPTTLSTSSPSFMRTMVGTPMMPKPIAVSRPSLTSKTPNFTLSVYSPAVSWKTGSIFVQWGQPMLLNHRAVLSTTHETAKRDARCHSVNRLDQLVERERAG